METVFNVCTNGGGSRLLMARDAPFMQFECTDWRNHFIPQESFNIDYVL